ncbi:MAG: hypothetical protein CL847_06125 [Crocinitomicaceae bacterium]|nr:hypothetical protein [Crocinitomicaceae bacterium]|tara:strand:- start:13855 stop:14985 length:1131 start_codon:yes stop_codon:yes gene_type:complete
MVEISFFSDSKCDQLYPMNLGRCVSTLNYGARSISDQWNDAFIKTNGRRIRLNSRLLPTYTSVNIVHNLRPGDQWIHEGILIAEIEGITESIDVSISTTPLLLSSPKEIFEKCGDGIKEDLERIKSTWRTRTLDEEERNAWAQSGVFVQGPMDRIHLAPGAIIRPCSLNTENGDIAMGSESEIMEGCNVRGPFVMGANSQVKMGTNVYGPTGVGSNCRIGGEIKNSVIHDYSNKAHGGFIGNSVIGSWCNLGAETTTSNLKNNYSEVSVWDNESNTLVNSGRTFLGLFMGDHSKTAIHTAFNTGTVVGAFCNVFGNSTPSKHIKSFTWGGAENSEDYDIDKALDAARIMMQRRDIKLSSEDELNIRQLHKSSTFDI